MARQKVPQAPKTHPAFQILADHSAQEIADALGLKVAYIYSLKKNLKMTMADRIVAAFTGAPAAPVPAPKKETKGKPCAQPADAFLRQVEEQEKVRDAEALARNAVANIAQTELLPALEELIGRLGHNNQAAAYLVMPLTPADLKKLKGA
jgi:hypothetical protein